MSEAAPVELELQDAGGVGQARLRAKELARDLGVHADAADRLVLVVSELATTLVVHGGGGTIVLQPKPGATVTVVAAAGGEGEGDGDGDGDGGGDRGAQATSPSPSQATLGQNLALVRRLAASVSIEPGHRITAVVELG